MHHLDSSQIDTIDRQWVTPSAYLSHFFTLASDDQPLCTLRSDIRNSRLNAASSTPSCNQLNWIYNTPALCFGSLRSSLSQACPRSDSFHHHQIGWESRLQRRWTEEPRLEAKSCGFPRSSAACTFFSADTIQDFFGIDCGVKGFPSLQAACIARGAISSDSGLGEWGASGQRTTHGAFRLGDRSSAVHGATAQ